MNSARESIQGKKHNRFYHKILAAKICFKELQYFNIHTVFLFHDITRFMIKTNQTVFLKLSAFNQKYSKNYSDDYVNYAYLNEHIYTKYMS